MKAVHSVCCLCWWTSFLYMHLCCCHCEYIDWPCTRKHRWRYL